MCLKLFGITFNLLIQLVNNLSIFYFKYNYQYYSNTQAGLS